MLKELAICDQRVRVAVSAYLASDDRTVLQCVCPGGEEAYAVTVQSTNRRSSEVATWLTRTLWPAAVAFETTAVPPGMVSAERLCAWANASPSMRGLLRALDRADGRVFVVTHAGNGGDRWTVQQFDSRTRGDYMLIVLRGSVPSVYAGESLYVSDMDDQFTCLTPEFLRSGV